MNDKIESNKLSTTPYDQRPVPITYRAYDDFGKIYRKIRKRDFDLFLKEFLKDACNSEDCILPAKTYLSLLEYWEKW